MFDAFIRFLIAILLVAACVFLFVWVLGIAGIVIPHQLVVIFYAIAALFCILIAWRFFGGYISNSFVPPPPPPPKQ